MLLFFNLEIILTTRLSSLIGLVLKVCSLVLIILSLVTQVSDSLLNILISLILLLLPEQHLLFIILLKGSRHQTTLSSFRSLTINQTLLISKLR